MGQILSLRYDVFSAEFCAELSGLQDRAPGFPAETALSIFHNEMLIPVEDVFEYFEEQPVAAASIAQVHKARLRKGRVWVAVKVQRPNAKRELRQDMAFIRYVVRILDWLPGLSALHGKDMLWELENAFEEETDYRLEAASILQMRTSLKDPNIY
ncbi:MAG: AarF/UbiB family protein, partial [bacterium]|nr:AarF/UbiB family protein [bacterium]